MFEVYQNQDIGWRQRIDIKDNGTPIYDPPSPEEPKSIKANVKFTRRLIRNAQGEQVISEALVISSEKINDGDILEIFGREWPVQKCTPITGLTGNELHREVYL